MNNLSSYSLVICILAMLYTGFIFYPKWEKTGTEATISWDASGYYMYLPAIFIYKDIKECKFRDSILQKYHPTPDFQQASVLKSGGFVMKYSSGQAILMSPFFGVAHLYACNDKNYPPDGFSKPYQVCIGLGMFLYALLGIFLFRKIFLTYFSDKVVAILLLCLVLGTNYLDYGAIDQAMTHSTLFTIYCGLILSTIQFYKKYSLSGAILIGALCGLATLVRPTEIISTMIPLFWGLSNWESIRERINFIKSHSIAAILAIIAFSLFVSIQLIYWKYSSGSWIFYSYDDQGFSFMHPHLIDYIFSYHSGWLRYCPMMLLPFFGLIILHKIKRQIWPVIVAFMLINLYIVASWDIWWYGGRAMVQSYPIMFFPIAALIEFIEPKRIWRLLLYTFILLSIYINIWWTYHCHFGNINLTNPTRAYYWKVIGRWNVPANTVRYLDHNEWYDSEVKNESVIYSNDFEDDTSNNVLPAGLEGKSIFVNNNSKFSAEYAIPLPEIGAKWIRVSADAKISMKEFLSWDMGQLKLRFIKKDGSTREVTARADHYLDPNVTGNIYLDARLDPNGYKGLSVYIYNDNGQKTFIIDNLKVITFR